MRYSITSAQLSHLQKEGELPFEGLYSEAKVESLRKLVEEAPQEGGRDIHRENPPLLSALHTSMLGQVASQLFGKKQIKIAFTQRLPFYEDAASLEEVSSITEVLGGALIDLETGNILFVMPQTLLDLPNLEKKLLIAFSTEKARYSIQELDPISHWLKHLGYASGDRLSDQTHPLIHK